MPNRGSADNLCRLYEEARSSEREEGSAYYDRQRLRLATRADKEQRPLTAVVAAFAALSPNNGEATNYRALDRALDIVAGRAPEEAKVAAYPRNKAKALALLRGASLNTLSGCKVRSFYHNTLDPDDGRHVTVDGHMLGAWASRRYVLRREAHIPSSEYPIIANDFRSAAECYRLPAPRFQAVLWLTWKRKLNILYSPQMSFEWDALG